MLLKFKVRNYKSIKEEACLDMESTRISDLKEEQDRVIDIANKKVLKIAAIYGANASGKSNLIDAFHFMSYYILFSERFDDEKEKIYAKPFLFSDTSKNKSTEFEIEIACKNKTRDVIYKYGFKILESNIEEEWLCSRAKTSKEYQTVFSRKKNKIKFDKVAKKYHEHIDRMLTSSKLVVTIGKILDINYCNLVSEWISDNEIERFADNLNNTIRESSITEEFIKEPSHRERIIKFLNTFDDSIKAFKLEAYKDDRGKDSYSVYTTHKYIREKNEIKSVDIPLSRESEGTRKMFSLFSYLEKVLKRGSVFMADELDLKLHPILTSNLIKTFASKETNPNNAQLVFTTHETYLLDNKFLRRDEIWIMDKYKDFSSVLMRFNNFGWRNDADENYRKVRFDVKYLNAYLKGDLELLPPQKPFKII